MLWAYFSFSQLLIIWSGNQPERSPSTTRVCTANGRCRRLVLIFHFFVPFFLLLSRDSNATRTLAQGRSLAHFHAPRRLFWMTRPEFTPHAWPNLWDLAAVLALGGLWFFVFAGH